MTVAAANNGWFPRFFTVIGRVGPYREPEPEPISGPENPDRIVLDAPVNAILLSILLSALYIIFGDFRSLLTFNGLGEYTFFFLTVVGAIVLRFKEPGLKRPYKPLIVIPFIFAIVSGFVILRGAAFAPAQALVLFALWILGVVFYHVNTRITARSA